MIIKLDVVNPDIIISDTEILEEELIRSILNNKKVDKDKIPTEMKEIIRFYKLISDDISEYIYKEMKDILIDIKRISILIQMLTITLSS